MYCKHCGKPIDEDSTFCRHCGKQQVGDKSIKNEPKHEAKESKKVQPKKKKREKNNSRNVIIIFCAGLLVLMAIIVLVICKFHDEDNKRIADITIDKVSKELAEATKKYDRLDSFHEGLASVCKDEKWGFIDKLGQEIIPCKYDYANDFEYGIAIVELDGKEGAINNRGKVVIPFDYDRIGSYAQDSAAVAEKDGKYGIIDMKGNEIVPFIYEDCDYFHEGMAAVVQNGKLGFVNRKGALAIECQYDYEDIPRYHDYMKFVNGLAAVRKDGVWGYIDESGKTVIPFNKLLKGMPFYRWTSIISRQVDSISLYEYNTLFTFIDCNGKPDDQWYKVGSIWDAHGVWEDGYLYFKEKNDRFGSYGLLDIQGKIIILPNEYSNIVYRREYVIVKQHPYEGLFDLNTNKLTVPIEYEDIGLEITEGLIVAKKDNRCGFINIKNDVIIPFEYERAWDFSEGFAVVKRFGKYGYVDRFGNDTFNIK